MSLYCAQTSYFERGGITPFIDILIVRFESRTTFHMLLQNWTISFLFAFHFNVLSIFRLWKVMHFKLPHFAFHLSLFMTLFILCVSIWDSLCGPSILCVFFCILYESIISSSMRFCLHINIQNWSFVYIFTSKLRFCLHLKVQYWNFVCIASSTFTYHLVSLPHHLHPWDSNFVYS